jgi:gliding motility-associated-like protein
MPFQAFTMQSVMRKVTCTMVLWLCAFSFGHAQRQGDRWYFGDGLGLSFSSGEPNLLTDGSTYNASLPSHSEASSVICDSDGNLLFYTNGEKIWDRNHEVMPNGQSILGNFSSTQGALIVPLPQSRNIFYVFTTDGFYESDLKNGLRYSVVDMCLNDSLGDIVVGQKNILLLDTVAEKLSAVLHTNGTDYWVVTHKYFSNAFYSYRLTPDGIEEIVVSKIGSTHPDTMAPQGLGAALGQLKFSPDGSRLAIVNGNSSPSIAELCDFNPETGVVSGCFSLQVNPVYNYYGVSFSPDNTKLYISCWLNNQGVYQFNLLAGDPESIRFSRTAISNYIAYGMQLANNGKIYLTRTNVNHHVDVIHEPNNLGLACNLEDSAIYLQGKVASMGLPNFIDSYAYTNGLVSCSEEELLPDTLTVPTVFTPDGDGINDSFNLEHLPKGSGLVIYSRWGREVFRTDNYINGWDAGNVTGGVYYYILTLPDGVRKKGMVQALK